MTIKRDVSGEFFFYADGLAARATDYKQVIHRADPDQPIDAVYYDNRNGREWEATYDNLKDFEDSLTV